MRGTREVSESFGSSSSSGLRATLDGPASEKSLDGQKREAAFHAQECNLPRLSLNQLELIEQSNENISVAMGMAFKGPKGSAPSIISVPAKLSHIAALVRMLWPAKREH